MKKMHQSLRERAPFIIAAFATAWSFYIVVPPGQGLNQPVVITRVVNGVNQIETLYFDAPSAIWVHPRRANSWAYAADSTNRPLFTKGAYGQFNQVGRNEDSPTPQGYAGELYGLPVIKNANIPTTANSFTGNALNLTGGTQDPVCIVDESQLWLWESPLKLRALPEVLSGTLQIRYQAYAYSAFMANRFPTAISVLAGAGLAAPGF
jgi:hypothetical protein